METKKTPFDLHLFVCTNERDNKASCGGSGAAHLRDALKKACKERFPNTKIRVNASGCLGLCEEGIVAMAYPQQKTLTHLNQNDTEAVLAQLDELIKLS
jgi:predicted metal-binding protein